MRTPMRRLVRRPGEPTTSRRATSAFAARLAGSVVGVAGITLMGAGTFAHPGSVFAAGNNSVVSDFTCSSGQVCIHTSQVPTTGDQAGCADIAGLLGVDGLDSSDSYWHFVIPSSQGFEFNGTAFAADFSGGTTESTTFVQQRNDGGYKGVVVEADGGVTLNWALVPASGIIDEGSDDTSPDFNLSSSCAGDATSSSTTSSTSQTTSSQSSSSSSSSSSTSQTTSSSSDTSSSSSTTSSTASTPTTTSSDTTSSSTTTSSTASTPTTTSSDTTSSQTTSSQFSTALTTTVTDPSTSTSTESSSSSTASNPSTSTSTVSSSSSSASNPSTGVLGASTTTPSTGADVEFGLGIALLLGGAGVMIGATRFNRNKRH